jgi:hypothetical protein
MNAIQENNPIYNPEAVQRFKEFFGKINKGPVVTLGQELAESAPDAVLVALGARAGLPQNDRYQAN